MRENRFRYASAVEAAVVGVVVIVIIGVTMVDRMGDRGSQPAQFNAPAAATMTNEAEATSTFTANDITATVTAEPGTDDVDTIPESPREAEITVVGSMPEEAIQAAHVTLRPAEEPPLITVEQAMYSVHHDWGVPWGLGDEFRGKTPWIQAAYGRATFGYLHEDGTAWVGVQNQVLPDGTLIERIEDRLVWIIQYNNVAADTSLGPLDVAAYVIDAETGWVFHAWSWGTPYEETHAP